MSSSNRESVFTFLRLSSVYLESELESKIQTLTEVEKAVVSFLICRLPSISQFFSSQFFVDKSRSFVL